MIFGKNKKPQELFNGSICTVVEFRNYGEDKKKQHGDWVLFNKPNGDQIETVLDVIGEWFQPTFCQTVYRYQGATIKDDFTVHELPLMTKREIYTSLSRGVALNKVHFKYTSKQFVNSDVSRPVELKIKIDNEVDEKYKEGKIYKITFKNKIYIGQTIQTLEQRFEQHKTAETGSHFVKELKNHLSEAKIELVDNYPCKSQKELLARETYIIEKFLEDNYLDLYNKVIELLNTVLNRKKVRETVIDQTRVDKITEEQNIYNIVENSKKNCLRYQAKINDKKIDISVSLNNTTKELAMIKMMKKIDALHVNNQFVLEF